MKEKIFIRGVKMNLVRPCCDVEGLMGKRKKEV